MDTPEDPRSCFSCVNASAPMTSEPCKTCFSLSKWGPKQGPDGPGPIEVKTNPQPGLVVKPAHYTRWPIEPINFIMRNGFEYWRGNIVKYAARAGAKVYGGMSAEDSEITDLQKVIRYAEMRINQIKGEPEL